jgi:hypothetical protein
MTLGEPDIIETKKIFLAVLNVTDSQETMQRVEESDSDQERSVKDMYSIHFK